MHFAWETSSYLNWNWKFIVITKVDIILWICSDWWKMYRDRSIKNFFILNMIYRIYRMPVQLFEKNFSAIWKLIRNVMNHPIKKVAFKYWLLYCKQGRFIYYVSKTSNNELNGCQGKNMSLPVKWLFFQSPLAEMVSEKKKLKKCFGF